MTLILSQNIVKFLFFFRMENNSLTHLKHFDEECEIE